MQIPATKWTPADIIKGYEVGKGEYLELDPDELDAVALESKRIIEIDEFVPKQDIDELYLNSPYYIVPDGEVGQQAFAVIREAIRKEGMVAIGKVVFTSREHIIALEARGKGLIGVTLRYPYEVRKEDEYFDDIADEKIPKDMLDLATHIVETKTGKFDPDKFEDRYEDALKDLLKKKQSGVKIEKPKERAPSNVINLMDALRQSVKAEQAAPAKKGKKRDTGQKEMLMSISGSKPAKDAAKKEARRSQPRHTRDARRQDNRQVPTAARASGPYLWHRSAAMRATQQAPLVAKRAIAPHSAPALPSLRKCCYH